jgi:NAD(P)H-hydrate epimerase
MMAIDLNAQYLGVSDIQLMENAGSAVAHEVSNRLKNGTNVTILAGTGGNGGDGMVAARHLASQGFHVKLLLLGDPATITRRDVRENWRTLESMAESVALQVVNDSSLLPRLEGEVIVDALLGTGAKGNLRSLFLKGVRAMNHASGFKLAVDIPTGIDSDSGKVLGEAFKADATITFHKSKPGLEKAPLYVGKLTVADIGIPPEAEKYVGPGDVYLCTKPRISETHKGDYGRVLVIGGSEDFHGAPTLAAVAAMKVGVDLTYVAVPEFIAHDVASYSPSLIVIKLKGRCLSQDNIKILGKWIPKASAVVLGPGLGLETETRQAVKAIIDAVEAQGIPLLLDADGLKAFAEFKHPFRCPAVITPHAGEFQVLTGNRLPENINDRVALVSETSRLLNCVTIVKSPVDIVSDGKNVKINRFVHNPGMTVGGTGDVLSGIVGALLSQGYEPFRAACAGVFINGAAGDFALKELGYHLLATDLLEWIPKVMNDPLSHLSVRHH